MPTAKPSSNVRKSAPIEPEMPDEDPAPRASAPAQLSGGMEKVQTGISGLDEMLGGGIPAKRHVAIYGGPGSGKTSFGFEYVYRGAKKGENSIYISLEETEKDILENMSNTFPMFRDMEDLIDEKKMEIVKPEKLDLIEVAELLESRIVENNVKRAVIDSMTMIKAAFSNDSEYRQTLFEFLSLLRNLDCTTMNVIEAETARKEDMRFSIEQFAMDGIINLYSLDRGDTRVRALEIFKMRGANHSRDLVPFKVTPSGIKVYVGEKVF
ncbi:MAG: RAD55 family ATPase [Candidatus Bilamarchaeaceae archaeon]